MIEYQEHEKALALSAVIEIFGEEITQDADWTVTLMQLYLKGYYAAKP